MLCIPVRVVRRQGHICGKIKHFFSERCGNVPYFNVFDALTGGNARTIRLCPKQYKIAKDLSEIENIGLLWAKVPMFCLESTEVSIKEVRCFRFPVPILFPREAVSVSPLLKKFFENILHFLHHKGKCIVITDDFG